MATALTLERYLTQNGVPYDVVPHAPTSSSMWTAQECHVPAECLAKAVVLKEEDDRYLLAVLPASHHLEVRDLEAQLDRHVELASEDEIEHLFTDCERGAVPPVGAAYGIDTIVDDSIADMPDVYFEGGDHRTLVHLRGPAFSRLMAGAPHGRFSMHV